MLAILLLRALHVMRMQCILDDLQLSFDEGLLFFDHSRERKTVAFTCMGGGTRGGGMPSTPGGMPAAAMG